MPDLNLKPYEYVETGRRPLTLFALLVGLFMLGLAIWHVAPWPFWIPLVLYMAGVLYLVVLNPRSSTRLTPEIWRFDTPGYHRSFKVLSISHVSFHPETDGPDVTRIHFHDGTTEEPPAMCLPSPDALRPHLARAGIEVRD